MSRQRLRGVIVRASQGLAVLALSYLFVFLLLFFLPGDPIRNRLNDPELNFTQEQVDQLLAYYGLDQPLLVQLWNSLSRLARGDLGYSLVTVTPVNERIVDALPSTLQLLVVTLVIALGIAFVLSALAIAGPGAGVQRFAAAVPAAVLSVPVFVIGLLVLLIFSYGLGWFNTLQADSWASTVPAAAVLALPVSAPFARVFIENAREVQHEPYVTFARSKGLTTFEVLTAHVAKPASLPAVTMFGLALGELVAGSVIVESLFNRQGIGSVISSAVSGQDAPVLLGVILLTAATIVTVNFLVDLLYPVLDPRLRSGIEPESTTNARGIIA